MGEGLQRTHSRHPALGAFQGTRKQRLKGKMVGGTRFEPVTPTMSILESPSMRPYILNNFNALLTVKLEHCCSLVVGLWLS